MHLMQFGFLKLSNETNLGVHLLSRSTILGMWMEALLVLKQRGKE